MVITFFVYSYRLYKKHYSNNKALLYVAMNGYEGNDLFSMKITKTKFKLLFIAPHLINIIPILVFVMPYFGVELDSSDSNYLQFLLYAAIMTLIFHSGAAVYYYRKFIDKSVNRLLTHILFNACVYPFLVVSVIISVFNVNVLLDPRDEQIHFAGEIIKKSASESQRGTTYTIDIQNDRGANTIDVSRDEFNDHVVGDYFQVSFYKGRFNFPWRFQFHFF